MARKDFKIKKANKNATKGKARPWKKGQSSSYNPQCNKHRLAAKKRAVFGNPGKGNLTEAMLVQHNKLTSEQGSEIDDMSIGGETAITAFTNCSLPSFNRLQNNWSASSFLHKEMVAVLAAVTEVIKINGGNETETEYFAALMTTLETVDTDEEITAVICLLSMVVKKLDESVLKINLKTTCDVCVKLLIKYMNSDYCAMLRNLLLITFKFLKVKTQWTTESDELKAILEFTTHHKPKVRKVAHFVVKALLVDCIPESHQIHPGTSFVAKFCAEKLEVCGGVNSSDSRDIFYVLSLLEKVMSVFPRSSIKKTCETIFKVMMLSNAMVTLSCLKALQGLFQHNPSAENLPADLNARIIMALYDYQPNVRDSQNLICWLQLMQCALTNLLGLDETLCLSHLPKFFSVTVKCWLNEGEEAMFVVAVTLKNLLQQCFQPSSEAFQKMIFEHPIDNPMHKVFGSIEGALSYQFNKAWKHVLSVLTMSFEVAGKHCYTAMMKCLQSLGDLRDSFKFPHIPELEKAIGVAIEKMGPRIVMQAIPLGLEGLKEKPDFPRSWMLPLLRDHIRNTELDYFVRYFLPLAAKMRQRAQHLSNEGKPVESKLYEVICSQIWSLLPGFCTEPTDLKESFKGVAQTLGFIIRDDPTLRLTVLSSLRLLINKNLDNEENRTAIAHFAKNYLPILFNLYTTESDDKAIEKTRLAILDTVRIFLQITDKELCAAFFNKAMDKLNGLNESDIFMQHALLDVCKVMVSRFNDENLIQLYEYSKPLLKHSNHTIQKKAHGIIKEICSSSSDECTRFIQANFVDIQKLLGGDSSSLNPSTRALRLNCLRKLVSQFSESDMDAIKEVISEAVISTKTNSTKARAAAFDLLIEIGHSFKSLHPDSPRESIKEYMKILLTGLSGNPHVVSAAILAIGRVMYEFKDDMDSDLIHLLIENTCMMMNSKSREVIVSGLSFFKILFTTLDTVVLAQHVDYLVKSVTSISEENQRHFRFKAKEIFVRLIRKFGYEMISKMVPEQYQKQLTNIRKTESRKIRRRNSRTGSDSEISEPRKRSQEFGDILADSDSDDQPSNTDVKSKSGKSRATNKSSTTTYIEEHGENDIVDFLDPAVNKKLLNVKPQKEVGVKKRSSFPVSKDGKLIIKDDDDDVKSKVADILPERTEVLSALGAIKRKKRKMDDSEDEFETTEYGGSTSKASKGIHRKLTPLAKKKRPGEEFKAKKAKGDIKKGNVDPYAYLPFNRQALNKRKKVKLQGQFKNIVKAAKKGANIGSKRKSKQSFRKKHKGI